MLRGSVVRGIVFSVYDKFGPQNLYSFPPPVEEMVDGFGPSREERIQKKRDKLKEIHEFEEKEKEKEKEMGEEKKNKEVESKNKVEFGTEDLLQEFTHRDYLQIAIKSVSLLIGEKILEKDSSLLKMSFFGVIPYPDLDVCAHTYFKFYSKEGLNVPKACTFSLLIDNSKRSYIYDNINFLKTVIKECVDRLLSFLQSGKWTVEAEPDQNTLTEINMVIFDFFSKLKLAEERPFSPIASKRQVKIVFAGLPNSGKTSFLLTINRKYSELIRRDSLESADIHIANMLGTTIVNWDVGGSDSTPQKFKTVADIYLYDANLLYFFIDPNDIAHLKENIKWFTRILDHLKEMRVDMRIFIIISKIDVDIADKPEIRELIAQIKSNFSDIILNYKFNFQFFETSIFDLTSVLRSFSRGIRTLIPNNKIAEYKLKEYSSVLNASVLMLFNENGLIMSDYAHDPDFDLKHIYSLKYIFETLGPQYIEIYKNMDIENVTSETLNLKVNKSENFPDNINQAIKSTDNYFKTKLDNSHIILMKKIEISDFSMFLILYVKDFQDTTIEKKFNENLEKLVKSLTEILEIYVI